MPPSRMIRPLTPYRLPSLDRHDGPPTRSLAHGDAFRPGLGFMRLGPVKGADLLDIGARLGERRHAAIARHRALAGIIGGEDERQIAVEIVQEPAQILGATL